MRQEYINELVVDFRLNSNLKLLRCTNRCVLWDQVLEDIGDVATPSENHSLPVNQLIFVSIVCAQIECTLVHARNRYVQDIIDFKFARVNDTCVRAFPCTVPVRLRDTLDVAGLADIDVWIGAETCCISIDCQM